MGEIAESGHSFTQSVVAARGRATTAHPTTVLHLIRRFRPHVSGEALHLEQLLPLLERQGLRCDVAAQSTQPASTSTHVNLVLLAWFAANAWRYDIVHLHGAIDRYFLYRAIAFLFRCRIVQSCTLDGLSALVDTYPRPYRGLVRRLCRLIDDVVAINPRLHADALTLAAASRVHLIPPGVAIPAQDPAQRDAARRRFGFHPDETVLLFVGGLCARKDVRFLIDNHPADLGRLQLLLVGPRLDDGYAAELEAAIAASPAADRIRLAGYLDSTAPAYRAADIFVFASRQEGCPMAVLEAMAHGIPVVARHLPQTTDSIVDHGRTGLLFDTAAQYQAAIRRLVADRTGRAAMGAAARAAVGTAHNLRMTAISYAALYRKQRPYPRG